MNDFRLALAQEVAEQIDADVLTDKCPDCPFPLIMKKDQGMPFCWFCVTDKMAALRGLTALTKARMASQGIFMVDEHIHPALAQRREQEERAAWPEGWSL